MTAADESAIRVRYCPSPTGLLHVGNLRTGLFAWLFARQRGGAFVLRIEDTDAARSDERFEQPIYRDLRWFGMDWDEGPDTGGPYGPYRQSERGAIYRDRAERLVSEGKAYRCFCSEDVLKRQAAAARARGLQWKYPGTCRAMRSDEVDSRIGAGDAWVVRLQVRGGAVAFDDVVHGRTRFSTDVISDPILLRSDATPTYNFAVVVDDALMKISDVIRGDDHLSNTPKQVLIYEALDFEMPRFAHLSTVLGPDRTRLSKRHGATSVAELREAGYLPEALMNYLALLGWSPGAEGSEIVPRARLVREFRLDRVHRSPAVFDFGKLRFINRRFLRESPDLPARIARALAPAGYLPDPDEDPNGARRAEWVGAVIDTLIAGVDVPSEVAPLLEDVLAFPVEDSADCRAAAAEDGVLDLIRELGRELAARDHLTNDEFRAVAQRLKQSTGRKGRRLFHPVRVALTARDSGPELDKLIPLVETGSRLGIRGIVRCRDRVAAFLEHHGR